MSGTTPVVDRRLAFEVGNDVRVGRRQSREAVAELLGQLAEGETLFGEAQRRVVWRRSSAARRACRRATRSALSRVPSTARHVPTRDDAAPVRDCPTTPPTAPPNRGNLAQPSQI